MYGYVLRINVEVYVNMCCGYVLRLNVVMLDVCHVCCDSMFVMSVATKCLQCSLRLNVCNICCDSDVCIVCCD